MTVEPSSESPLPRDAQVLIVGGGPVGLGLAIELGQRGVATLVLEAHHRPQNIPKGQNLTQRTMEHFQAWGVEKELRRAQPIPAEADSGGITAYGSLLHGPHHDWLKRNLVNDFYCARNARLPQYATEYVLRDRVAQLGGVKLHSGWQVESVEQEKEFGRVRAVNKDDGRAREFVADYVIGCDGSRSTVRQSAGISQTMHDHDKLMALLVFRSPEFDRLLQGFSGKSYFNVLHPDFAGYWQFFGRVDTDSTFFFHAPVLGQRSEDPDDLAAMLHRAVGAEFAAEFTYVGFWDLRFAIADAYRSGRILLAGDAAHSHPPYGGFGINTGFEDARNLGWKLAARLQGWGGEALLDSYHLERHAVFASTASDFIARSIENDRAFVRALDRGLDEAELNDALALRAKQAEADVYDYAPHYCGSPVIMGEDGATISAVGIHTRQVEPGRLLPQAQLPCGTCTCDRLGHGFVLITSDNTVAAQFALAADERGIPLDRFSGLGEIYGHDHIVIRPDRYVAWAASGPLDAIVPAAALRRACGLTG